MATIDELRTGVKNIVQNNKYNSLIYGLLNQGQLEIAGGMQSTLGSWLTPPLPGLFTIDTVDTATDAAYVSMPTNFQRCLQFVASSDGNEIDIAEDFIEFSETYPLLDKSGSVVECCEFGEKFYYQGIPTSAATITLHYYRVPTDMDVNDNDSTPDGIPSHLQRPLLVNYAVWKICEIINKEDIIHETNREIILSASSKMLAIHKDLFFNALRILELFIPYNSRGINLISES
jgi:hypothetical protein